MSEHRAPIANPFDLPQRSEAEQQAFFEAVLERALLAEAAVGVHERFYDLDGLVIRIAYAGPALETLFSAAIAHLEIEAPARIDATFHVWDSRSTGVQMLKAPCSPGCFTDRGDVWGMTSAQYRLAVHFSDFSVNLGDIERSTFIYWVDDPAAIPYWSKGSPMRTLFHWLMAAHGRQLLHAAAVGDENGAVLITGKGGVGKSTTSLASLDAGMQFIGDDYLVTSLSPEPRAISLYCTAKLSPQNALNFPRFAALATPREDRDEKTVLNLFPGCRDRIMRSMPLRAVMVPRVVPATETTFAPAPRDVVQRAASFTTMSHLPHAGHATHDFIEELVAALPALEIRLGSDLQGVPRAIRRWLAVPDQQAETGPEAPEAAHRPLVSVIIPVHNGARFLGAAVESILAQDYPALEIIVVDDGSTDEIEAAVRALPVDVRLLKRRTKGGPSVARNIGIKDVSGDLIGFLDVDDLWPRGVLHQLVDALAGDATAFVARGRAQLFRDVPESGGKTYLGSPSDSFPDYIGAALYRRAAFERAGLFDVTLEFGEDAEWFIRARQAGLAIAEIVAVTLLVRRHDGNMTHGRSMDELGSVRVLRRFLERRRAQQPSADGLPPAS